MILGLWLYMIPLQNIKDGTFLSNAVFQGLPFQCCCITVMHLTSFHWQMHLGAESHSPALHHGYNSFLPLPTITQVKG